MLKKDNCKSTLNDMVDICVGLNLDALEFGKSWKGSVKSCSPSEFIPLFLLDKKQGEFVLCWTCR